MSHEIYTSVDEFNVFLNFHKTRANGPVNIHMLYAPKPMIIMNTIEDSLDTLLAHIEKPDFHNLMAAGHLKFSIRNSRGMDVGGVLRDVYTNTMYLMNSQSYDKLYLHSSHPSKALPHVLKMFNVASALTGIRQKYSKLYHALHSYGLRGFSQKISLKDIVINVPAVIIPEELYQFISYSVLQLPPFHIKYLLEHDVDGPKKVLFLYDNILSDSKYLHEFKAAYPRTRGDTYFGYSIYRYIAELLAITPNHLKHLMKTEEGKESLYKLYERIYNEPHILDEFKATYGDHGGLPYLGEAGVLPRVGGRRKTRKGKHFKKTIKRRGHYKRTFKQRMKRGGGSSEDDDDDDYEMSVLDVIETYQYKGLYDLTEIYRIMNEITGYKQGYMDTLPNILDVYYLMNPENIVSADDIEFLISHILFGGDIPEMFRTYITGLLRDYTTGLSPEMAASMRERFPTQNEFIKEFLKFWSGVEFVNRGYISAGNTYKINLENSYYGGEAHQYLLNAHTCFYTIGVNMNVFDRLATPDERLTVIVGSLGGGMNQAGGFRW